MEQLKQLEVDSHKTDLHLQQKSRLNAAILLLQVNSFIFCLPFFPAKRITKIKIADISRQTDTKFCHKEPFGKQCSER